MTSTLLKFGFVMVVVMIGFAMALHVLFRGRDSFGETFLGLFNAMLGDTGFFDEFSGERHDVVATILLVVYLFIVTIMLLNLLVAILSASHTKIQDNVEVEFKVSKARIIDHYQSVVEHGLLPAPFNLMQLVADLAAKLVVVPMATLLLWFLRRSLVDDCCFRFGPLWIYRYFGARMPEVSKVRVRREWQQLQRTVWTTYGRLVFWAVLGPVAVAGGALLWIMSSFPYAQYAWYTQYKQEKASGKNKPLGFYSRVLRCFLMLLWCLLGAPLCLLLLWVTAPWWFLFPSYVGKGGSAASTRLPTVGSMLRKGPGGVGADKLRKFLEDPMDDIDVRQDERDRRTTVEHMKLLRNRLEATTKKELNELRSDVKEMGEQLQRVLRIVEKQN